MKLGIGRIGLRFMEEGRERILSCLYYVDDFVLCCKLEQDLKVMVECFFEVRRSSLKVNPYKSKAMVLGREEGLECEICVGRSID